MSVCGIENQPLIPSAKCNETLTEDTTKPSFIKILSAVLLCVCPVLFCLNFHGKEPTHADSCTAVPSISWSSLHTIPHDRHHLRVGHELTDRLHITNGSVQVHLNEEISETTVRFDLKLTEESQIDLIQMKQVTQSNRIALIVDADTTAEIPLCITLDITIELPSFSALDSLSIETSNATIDVESGMYFPQMMQLKTTDGNITVKNSVTNKLELNTVSGFIDCTVHEIPNSQIEINSVTGNMSIDYTGLPPTRIPRGKTSIAIRSVSGNVDAWMRTDSVLFDMEGSSVGQIGWAYSPDHGTLTEYNRSTSLFKHSKNGLYSAYYSIDEPNVHVSMRSEGSSISRLFFSRHDCKT